VALCKSEDHSRPRGSPLASSDRGRVAGGDDFIANLWNVHLRVKEEGYVQVCVVLPLSLDLATDICT
jgi:hypothetical protein